MTAIDWALLAVLALSVLLGLARGVVREIFALAGWIAGVLLAIRFAEPLGAWLPDVLPSGVRVALAAILIVVAILLTAALAAALLRAALKSAKVSLEDRLLGGTFGVLRATLLIAGAVLLAMASGLPREPWWQASALLPRLQAGVGFATPWLPPSFTRHMAQNASHPAAIRKEGN